MVAGYEPARLDYRPRALRIELAGQSGVPRCHGQKRRAIPLINGLTRSVVGHQVSRAALSASSWRGNQVFLGGHGQKRALEMLDWVDWAGIGGVLLLIAMLALVWVMFSRDGE